jgi:phage tail protein X
MAAKTYVTKEGDMIDLICWQQYKGRMTGTVEAVFDANPCLEDMGPLLPAGLVLILPDVSVKVTPTVYLWS